MIKVKIKVHERNLSYATNLLSLFLFSHLSRLMTNPSTFIFLQYQYSLSVLTFSLAINIGITAFLVKSVWSIFSQINLALRNLSFLLLSLRIHKKGNQSRKMNFFKIPVGQILFPFSWSFLCLKQRNYSDPFVSFCEKLQNTNRDIQSLEYLKLSRGLKFT